MEYGVEILGARTLALGLDRMPDIVRVILREKVEAWLEEAEDELRATVDSKASQTGTLSSAVMSFLRQEGSTFSGGVGFDLDIAPYARIQDRGGVIPPHMIFPNEAKRLAFIGATGEKVIVRKVFHPGARIPAQHFIKDVYRGMSAEISLGLKRAVIQGIRANMRRGAINA